MEYLKLDSFQFIGYFLEWILFETLVPEINTIHGIVPGTGTEYSDVHTTIYNYTLELTLIIKNQTVYNKEQK